MLFSMTGFGEARRTVNDLAISIEVRAINNRFFKLAFRSPDGYNGLDQRVESAVRKHVRRGTVQVQLRIERPHSADDYRLNLDLLRSFSADLARLPGPLGCETGVPLGALLGLPGVVEEVTRRTHSADKDWSAIEPCLEEALAQLRQMRAEEGASLANDLAANNELVEEQLDAIEARAPVTAQSYRQRLAERVKKSLAELNVVLDPSDLVREVCLFAERSDISEELVRLRSHIEQFRDTLQSDEPAGKKLEFVAQEMGRETNTIGSKASDTEIANHVFEMKSALERIREQVQNIE